LKSSSTAEKYELLFHFVGTKRCKVRCRDSVTLQERLHSQSALIGQTPHYAHHRFHCRKKNKEEPMAAKADFPHLYWLRGGLKGKSQGFASRQHRICLLTQPDNSKRVSSGVILQQITSLSSLFRVASCSTDSRHSANYSVTVFAQ
jgi:hypothetical protein